MGKYNSQDSKMPAIRGADSKKKTRRHTRDLDQIHADLHSRRHLEQHIQQYDEAELPALGLFYCIPCAKHFESETNYAKHEKGKPHKRRVRQLKEEPYSQKEAEAAVGLTTDNGRKKGDEGTHTSAVSKDCRLQSFEKVLNTSSPGDQIGH